MKQQKEVNSKAGTLKRKTTMKNVFGEISKVASMLLVAIAGFGMMSFTQDDASVSSIDTNLNLKKETRAVATAFVTNSDACCGTAVAKPGDDIKKAVYISMPAAHRVVKADKEAAKSFEAEIFSRRLWSMDIVDATQKADAEMNFNFKMSNVTPAFEAGATADAEMSSNFTDEILKTANFAALQVNAADAEMIDNFIAEHLSIKSFTPSAALIAGADTEISRAFEKANLHITLPSHIALSNADLEMIQGYQMTELKNVQTVATK